MTEKNVSTRMRLLIASVYLFSEKGKNGVSVQDICQRANANIAAVNYHFRDKQNLYDQAWLFAFKEFKKHASFLEEDKDLPPEDRLKSFIKWHFSRHLPHEENNPFKQLLLKEMVDKSVSDPSLIHEAVGPQAKFIEKVFNDLYGEELSPQDLLFLRFTLMSQCLMPLLAPFSRAQEVFKLSFSQEDLIDHVHSVVIEKILSMKKKRSHD